MSPLAIVGMACRYPGANTLEEFWQNILAERRAFRRIPPERLNAEDYVSPRRDDPDKTYCATAAVLEGYEFDRVRFRVSGDAFRSSDMAHWLALDVAAEALADAGFPEGRGLPRETTGVFLGNTLTGEFSRAGMMRLRWPYVRRVLEGSVAEAALEEIEARYKAPFPEPGDETLAGSLSNTIAGRICNHFDLKGGGYTVDGACASSLLSAANACAALVSGDLDAAVAGGVDLSLDPLELVGFARVGALAKDEMRVYDTRSDGFFPGEGCGMLVLMRLEDALAQGRRVYASVSGWGISSDGKGGITRPEVEGQVLAMRRAYRRAGFDIGTVAYFEGHGTGTAVGDATELAAVSQAGASRAAIGSVKALIGHTKAAAGAASLIKAALALHHQIIPATAGCERPHAEIARDDAVLSAPKKGLLWPHDSELRAGVSGMGFGGINAHVVLEGRGPRRGELRAEEEALLGSGQDAELFLFATDEQLERVRAMCGRLSRSELTDLSAALARGDLGGSARAAVVASTPEELASTRVSMRHAGVRAPRVGFLFPGQGSLKGTQAELVAAEVAGLRALERIGITADVAVGHSLGELTALHWAGAIDEETLLRISRRRGDAMSCLNGTRGAMAAIVAGEARVRELLNGSGVVVAAVNSPRQTVISGAAECVADVVARARAEGLATVPLAVSHAFHSSLVEPAAANLRAAIADENFCRVHRRVISTVTGRALTAGVDLRELMVRQVTAPVRFADALAAAGAVDLWIEVGPGNTLAGPTAECGGAPVISLNSGGTSIRGLLNAVAAAFTLGVPVRTAALFEGRFARPFRMDWAPSFLGNPCEGGDAGRKPVGRAEALAPQDLVRALIAERAELPVAALTGASRVLSDLHLNSIVVSGIIGEAFRRVGLPVPIAPTEYADASIDEITAAIENASKTGAIPVERFPAGVDSWIRVFETAYVERPLRKITRPAGEWVEVRLGPNPVGQLLDAAHKSTGRFALIQSGDSAASFARALHLEGRDLTTCVISVPEGHPRAEEWVRAEMEAAGPGYTEAHYDALGVRREAVLRLCQINAAEMPLTSNDLLLVTGGSKGIAAECALALARETGVRLALMGRSQADVTDENAVRDAVRRIESERGPITAFLHGAGVNTPQLLSTLDETAFRATLAPKVQGCRNVLAALDPSRLRLVIGFGSIIARIGLPGEADYALANEWLARLLDRWQGEHPHCRAITLEWSLWSGVGMGQRLGRVEALMQQGITPIPTDDGVRLLQRILASDFRGTSCVVAGRFGEPPTVKLEEAPLPFRRFIDTRRVCYRGIELIADAEVSAASDPYILDHVFQGQAIFPAVMGLEAMVQIAMALAESSVPPLFENVEFARAVNVPATIRIAALKREDGAVEVVLRSSETGFGVDHFRAVCRFGVTESEHESEAVPGLDLPIDPMTDLYGGLLFQSGKFQRLRGYRELSAFRCVATIDAGASEGWFSRYHPQTLELGDPGARDAVLHSIQACIPHRPLLPVGVERIVLFSQPSGRCFSRARERWSNGSEFLYDVEVTNEDGSPRERWEGLRLRAVDAAAAEPLSLPAPLVAPYLERLIREAFPETDALVSFDASGGGAKNRHRPETRNGFVFSRSHAGQSVLQIAGHGQVGCDMETVVSRKDGQWLDLLGPQNHTLAKLVARETGESNCSASTRLWTVAESLKKAGAAVDAPIVLRTLGQGGRVVFGAGHLLAASCVVRIAGRPDEYAITVALGG